MNKSKRSQSMLEYVLVLTVVLMVMLATIITSTGPVRTGINNFFSSMGTAIGGIVK